MLSSIAQQADHLRPRQPVIQVLSFAAVVVGALPVSATAADLVGDCCADFEERIAELEATTARKGNRKVTLTISGQVNNAILFWDDGAEDDGYGVGNKNDQTNVSFTGDAKFAPGWSAGYDLTLRVRDTLSDDVNQNDNNGSGDPFQLWRSQVWVESENLGKVSLGRASRVSDTAPENDLSETGVAGYAGVQDIGGAFAFRRADGGLLVLGWGDVHNHFNGDTANIIRYDTPEMAGFVASASWGEDDVWDAGLRFEGDRGGFKLSASIGYTEVRDTDGAFADIEQSTVVGSVAVLHETSGLNALISAGSRQFDESIVDADGAMRTPVDPCFIYGKLGWIAKLNALGPTAFYGEYGWFKDFVSVQDDAGLAADLSLGGAATRISGNTAEVWGAGVVQHIEAAEMQVYVGFRNHSVDFDLVDGGGATVAVQDVEDFHTIIAGSKIAF